MPEQLAGQHYYQERRQRSDHSYPEDAPDDVVAPLLGGEGQVRGAVRLLEGGEGAGAFVGYKEHPEQDKHDAGDQVSRMQAKPVERNLPTPEPAATTSEVEVVPERGHKKEQGAVDGQEYRRAAPLPRRPRR